MQLVNIGEKLKTLSLNKNLTKKQIVDRIGLAISAISSYESGMRYPSYETLIKLARIFLNYAYMQKRQYLFIGTAVYIISFLVFVSILQTLFFLLCFHKILVSSVI